MNAIQKAEFITEQVAEIIKTALADLIGRKIIPKSKLSGLPSSSAASSTQEVHEAVTPEGIKIAAYHKKQGSLILKKDLNNSSSPNNTIQKLKPLNRGSTGRSIPENLTEKLVMEEIISNPNLGKAINVEMTDPRWLKSDGWIKMARNHEGIEVHYVAQSKNGIIQAVDDFKFIDLKK